jgi:hypothetical protein
LVWAALDCGSADWRNDRIFSPFACSHRFALDAKTSKSRDCPELIDRNRTIRVIIIDVSLPRRGQPLDSGYRPINCINRNTDEN